MKKTFDHKAFKGLGNVMNKIQAQLDRGIGFLLKCMQSWNKNTALMSESQRQKKNRDNRRSSNSPLHTGGSIPATEHYKRLVSLCYYMVIICLLVRLVQIVRS